MILAQPEHIVVCTTEAGCHVQDLAGGRKGNMEKTCSLSRLNAEVGFTFLLDTHILRAESGHMGLDYKGGWGM